MLKNTVRFKDKKKPSFKDFNIADGVIPHENENLQPIDDDIRSVATVETDIQSSTELLVFLNVKGAAACKVAEAFVGDSETSKLYDEGLRTGKILINTLVKPTEPDMDWMP